MMLTMFLAVAWVPLTAHCEIEILTGLEVLSCSSMEASAPPSDSHCGGNTCCEWESGQYRLPQGQPTVAAPLLAVLPQVLAVVTKEAPVAEVDCPQADTPPESQKPWQFSLRAALPVRAPSMAS